MNFPNKESDFEVCLFACFVLFSLAFPVTPISGLL